ncbi:MAG: tetratricopeptide repeat protein [Gallionella sp.]|nr:tetratricopeptide repeat protein [Gallionella sp.]
MSNVITKVLFGLILAATSLAVNAAAQAGSEGELHLHDHKKINAPAHCEDPSADSAAALKEFKPLAAKGDARAQFELGYMHERGKGVPQDYVEAASWYRKSAEQGNASAQFHLGQMYDIGKGAPQDYTEAASWYRKSAEQGGTLAQIHLGFLYEFGQGVPVDMIQAYKWYSLAALSGNVIALQKKKAAEAMMTPKDIKAAQTLTDEWLVQHK